MSAPLCIAALALALAGAARPVAAPVDELADLVAKAREDGEAADAEVYRAIAELGSPEAVAALRELTAALTSERRRSQAYLASELCADADPAGGQARAWLVEEALSGRAEYQQGAVIALLAHADEGLDELEELLAKHPDPALRRRVATPLAPLLIARGDDAGLGLALRNAAFDTPAPVTYLGTSIDDDFEGRRHRAVMLEVLGQALDDGRGSAIEVVAADRATPRGARLVLIGLLLERGRTEVLGPLLDDPDPSIVLFALGRLANSGDLAPFEAQLEGLVDHRDAAVRRQAVLSLNLLRRDDPGWRDQILKLARHKDRARRMAAAVALATNGDPRALDRLHGMCRDKDWSVRAEAYRALVAARQLESVSVLVERMAKEDGRLVDDVYHALRLLTGEDHGRNAKRWKAWWKGEGKSFELPDRMYAETAELERLERRAPNEYAPGDFYGVPVTSRRICFVLDVSGSMDEPATVRAGVTQVGSGSGPTKLEVAKDQLSRVLARLEDGVFFDLIFFGTGVETLDDEGLRKMTKRTRAESIRFVRGRQALGSTAVHTALERAFADEDVDTIYLLSDGAPTAGAITDVAELRDEVARWNAARHVRIHGISIERDSELLRWLAEDSGGRYVHVKDE